MNDSAGKNDPVNMEEDDPLHLNGEIDPKKASFRGNKAEKDAEKNAEEEAARAERMHVRKVSPLKKFFSSIRVVFILVVVLFGLAMIAIVGAAAIVAIRVTYEDFDELDMKERIQNAVHGTLRSTVAMFQRSMAYIMAIGTMSFEEGFPGLEEFLVNLTYDSMLILTEGPGAFEFEYLPYQLIVLYDENFTERVVWYRPCANKPEQGLCELLPVEEAHELKHKDKVPSYFKNMTQYMKSQNFQPGKDPCTESMKCSGFAPIPDEEGGPIIFSLLSLGDMSAQRGFNFAFDNWFFLCAANLQIFAEIQANRTGLCVSLFTEGEDNLTEDVREEFQAGRDRKIVMNPAAAAIDTFTYVVTYTLGDSGNWTRSQNYENKRKAKYVESSRQICDPFYDHGGDDFVSKTVTYLNYATFNYKTFGQDDSQTILVRFDYHNPLTVVAYHTVNIVVAILSIIWVLTLFGVFLYFNVQFLVPLDRMRKVREDLIKSALSGLEDDEEALAKAKDLFGDLTDDQALIRANGDEITVMLTLQDRMDGLYSSIIGKRLAELDRFRTASRRGLGALRVMNLFMRRDDEGLQTVLPGLLGPSEIVRYFRRTALTVREQKNSYLEELTNARHVFRTLKAVLNNSISVQYFKAYCTLRGKSCANSFFFLMDVSWLHQIETGARQDGDDFLSAMFSDSVSASPRTPGRSDKVSIASDIPASNANVVEASLADLEPNRPRHSHFARSDSQKKTPQSAEKDNDGQTSAKKVVPKLALSKIKGSAAEASSDPNPSAKKDVPPFLTKIGEGIAHFIHDCYFGNKSLARIDPHHSALLGCSQIPDYLALRDKEDCVYYPSMYDNLATAVTKKFTSEVLPSFLNSVTFQIMVRSLLITDYFKKKAVKEDGFAHSGEDKLPVFESDEVLKYMWAVTVSDKKKKTANKDDISSSYDDSTSSGGSSDEENDDVPAPTKQDGSDSSDVSDGE